MTSQAALSHATAILEVKAVVVCDQLLTVYCVSTASMDVDSSMIPPLPLLSFPSALFAHAHIIIIFVTNKSLGLICCLLLKTVLYTVFMALIEL